MQFRKTVLNLGKIGTVKPNFIIVNGVNRTLPCFQNFSPDLDEWVQTGYVLDNREIVVRFPADEENLSHLQNVQASSWT
jgi:hypothetical protein